MDFQPGTLYYGDCLDVMKEWPPGLIDLCYLDPPFNSKASYNILFGRRGRPDKQQTLAFEDTWHWDEGAAERVEALCRASGNPARSAIAGLHTVLGNCGMIAYLSYMAERLVEIRRVLKKSGSIFLHCDPTASHYLKIVMDAVFGQANFRNEVVWSYQRWTGATKHFQRMHDIILFYVNDARNAVFNILDEPYSSKSKHKARRHSTVTQVGGLEQTYTDDTSRLKAMRDVWEISYVNSQAKERLGYPTQKPVELLDRIVRAATCRGDIVLDPFCGCGTTIDAANRLNRQWAGIDISPFAIDLVKIRRLKDKKVPIRGVPIDIDSARSMARERPFDFEKWAITRIPGMMPNQKQVGDGGVDGRGYIHNAPAKSGLVLAQVKSGKFAMSHLRDFLHTVRRDKAALGIYITVEKVTSRNAQAEARGLKTEKIGATSYPRVQLWSIEDHFADREPKLPALADPFTGHAMQTDVFGDLI